MKSQRISHMDKSVIVILKQHISEHPLPDPILNQLYVEYFIKWELWVDYCNATWKFIERMHGFDFLIFLCTVYMFMKADNMFKQVEISMKLIDVYRNNVR